MRNAGLEETQAGIKIAGRNINKLRDADDTNLIAESEEELKSLLMKVKENSRFPEILANFRIHFNWPSLGHMTMPKPLTVWITIDCRQF